MTHSIKQIVMERLQFRQQCRAVTDALMLDIAERLASLCINANATVVVSMLVTELQRLENELKKGAL